MPGRRPARRDLGQVAETIYPRNEHAKALVLMNLLANPRQTEAAARA